VKFWLNAKKESKVDAELLQATLPGCTVIDWTPVAKPMTRVMEAWQIITEHFRSTSTPVFFRVVYQKMGMDRSEFRKSVRRDPEFLKRCQGIIQETWSGREVTRTPSGSSTQKPTPSARRASTTLASTWLRQRPERMALMGGTPLTYSGHPPITSPASHGGIPLTYSDLYPIIAEPGRG
jgi:hypothetical protein